MTCTDGQLNILGTLYLKEEDDGLWIELLTLSPLNREVIREFRESLKDLCWLLKLNGYSELNAYTQTEKSTKWPIKLFNFQLIKETPMGRHIRLCF